MRKTIFLTLAFVALAVSPAAAALNEYYTYGGFSPVALAFENMARIFGDPSYKGAIATLAIIGLFFGSAGGFLKMAMGQGGPLGWLLPFIVGVALYLGLFVPTINLAVYDPVYNQNKVIAGVPAGVAYISGMVNVLERFVVETFDTNAPLAPATACGPMTPMQYQQFGGAVGMRLMRNSSDQYVQSADASQTLSSYINDCVIFELNRPGTTLTIDKILTPGCGKTALDALADANNPANFTTSYFGSTAGTAKTCQAVYTELTTFFGNPLNSSQPGTNACAGTGFTDSARCQEILVNMLNASTGDSFDSSKFISNNTVASITNNALLTGGGASTSAYLTQINQAQTGASAGFMAGVVNPYMIDAYVSYSFMLMPILALFLVTPLWRNAIGLIISMIIWTTLLRCLDVITFHSWATQYQLAAAAALKSSGMGIDAAMRLPMLSNQYLGTFASMRNSVFLLATAVSGALFKFGDSAMSRLADKANQDHDGVKSGISDRGVAAKMAMDNAAGAARASMMSALASGTHGWDNVGKGMATNELAGAAAGAGTMGAYGGNVNSMMSGQAQVSGINTTQASARAGGMSEAQARGMGVNDAAAQKAVLERMGTDGKTAAWSAGLATDQNLGQAKGFQAAHQEAQKGGYKGDIQQFQSDMSKVTTEKGFADSQGWKDFVKDKFGGNEQAALQSATNVAAFQLGKHTGEVQQTMEGSGKSATGAGLAVGTTMGNTNLMSMASDSVRRAIAEQSAGKDIKNNPNLYRQADYTEAGKAKLAEQTATQQKERDALKNTLQEQHATPNEKAKQLSALEAKQAKDRQALGTQLKTDSSMYQKAGLTEAGYAAQMGNIAGANQQSYSDKKAYGDVEEKKFLDGNKNLIMSQEKGSISDKKHMRALAQELKEGGFKHTAKEIDKMAAQGKGFDFQMSRDKDGRITGFNASGGATATLRDKALEETGRLSQHTMKNVNDQRDQTLTGSDKLGGNRVLKDDTKLTKAGTMTTIQNGYTNDTYNKPNETHGIQTVNIDGKPTTVVGDTSRDAKGNIIAGNVDTGTKVDTVGFVQGQDGTAHKVRTTGVTDGSGKLIQGQRSENVKSEMVEQVRDEKGNTTNVALTTREGSPSTPNAKVTASGGTKVDVSSSYTFGKGVNNVQTLGGSASQDGFGDGKQLGVGTAATTVAIGERSIAVASEKVNQVSSIAAAVKPSTKSREVPDKPSLTNNPVQYVKDKVAGLRNPEVGKDAYTGASVRKNPEKWAKGHQTEPQSHVNNTPQPHAASGNHTPDTLTNPQPAGNHNGGLGPIGDTAGRAASAPKAPAKPAASSNSYDGITNAAKPKQLPANHNGGIGALPKPGGVKAPGKPGGATVRAKPSNIKL